MILDVGYHKVQIGCRAITNYNWDVTGDDET